MATTVTNLIQGPATLYAWLGALPMIEPADATINLALAATGYRDLGGTQDGVTLAVEQEWSDLDVDQIVDDPGTRLVKRRMTLATNLAEPTLANLALVLNDSAPVTATGVTTFEPSDSFATTQPPYSGLILEGYAPGGFRRRVIMRRAMSTEGTEAAYKKDGQALFPVKWRTFYVSGAVKPFKIQDQTA